MFENKGLKTYLIIHVIGIIHQPIADLTSETQLVEMSRFRCHFFSLEYFATTSWTATFISRFSFDLISASIQRQRSMPNLGVASLAIQLRIKPHEYLQFIRLRTITIDTSEASFVVAQTFFNHFFSLKNSSITSRTRFSCILSGYTGSIRIHHGTIGPLYLSQAVFA